MEITEIKFDDKKYPARLRNIKKPPKQIYVIGNKDILNDKGIAIVGSRDCTPEGLRNARLFSANIAKAGFTIISGMAKGIDAAAHSRSNRSKSEARLQYSDADLMLFFLNKIKKYIIKLLKQEER